jgi:Ca2+-binding EF-hand superfamily protein
LGCFWQEKPEDCVSLYLELMASPAFRQIHQSLWFRPQLTAFNASPDGMMAGNPIKIPAMTAWNDEDRNRISTVWNNFIQELKNSTNRLFQIEAKASTLNPDQVREKDEEGWLTIEPTKNDQDFDKEREYLGEWLAFQTILTSDQANRFKAKQFDPVEFLAVFQFRDYSTLQARRIEGSLRVFKQLLAIKANGVSGEDKVNYLKGIPLVESLQSDVNLILNPEEESKARQAFAMQIQCLTNYQSYDQDKFWNLFISTGGFRDYSQAQALEILPLLNTFKTNLTGSGAAIGAMRADQVIDRVNRILNLPPVPKPNVAVVQSTNRAPIRFGPPKVVSRVPAKPPEIVTNILTVSNYFRIPQDRMGTPDICDMNLGSRRMLGIAYSRWTGGKLLLDLHLTVGVGIEFVNYLSATAIFDPASGLWQFVVHPQDDKLGKEDIMSGTRDEDVWDGCIELFDNSLFLSFSGQIHKYDFKTRQWQILDFPGQKQSRLFAIGGHLYAANDETILEITDDGKGTRLLASTRRRPAASALDSIDSYGSPVLFSSSNHLLCADIGSKIYGWDGKDWQQVFTMDDLKILEPIDDGFIFRSFQGNLWVWEGSQSAPELWLQDVPKPQPGVRNNGLNQTNNPSVHPLGKSLPDVPLTGCVATFFKSNLYFLVDHAIMTNISGRWVATEKDGYNAKLVCLSRNWPDPLVIPLKFDLELMRHDFDFNGMSLSKSTWMHFSGENLYVGQADTMGLRTDSIPEADRLGYWTIPISEIEANIEAQKQIWLAKKHDEDEARRQLRDKMLAKYDHNHNGIIDPLEREEALDDPAVIESELNMIDANNNGLLDAEELVWFDAKTNKTLEPKEQAGIEISQHLLAQRLLDKYDANGDGLLDRAEFNDLVQASMDPRAASMSRSQFFYLDQNHDNHLDLGELETFLQQQTSSGLRAREMQGPAIFNQMRTNPGQPIDPRQMFKAAVEAYWQNPDVTTNRQSFNRVLPVGGAVTNGAQSGKP